MPSPSRQPTSQQDAPVIPWSDLRSETDDELAAAALPVPDGIEIRRLPLPEPIGQPLGVRHQPRRLERPLRQPADEGRVEEHVVGAIRRQQFRGAWSVECGA